MFPADGLFSTIYEIVGSMSVSVCYIVCINQGETFVAFVELIISAKFHEEQNASYKVKMMMMSDNASRLLNCSKKMVQR